MYGYCTHLYVLAGCVLCITSGFSFGGKGDVQCVSLCSVRKFTLS